MDEMIELMNMDKFELKSKKVYRIIKLSIVKGTYRSGEKLSDYKIAKKMGVSKTPVREALYRLISEGLLKSIPNRGIVVSDISKKDLIQVYELRMLIEGHVSYNLAKKIKKSQIKELENIIDEMNKCILKKDKDYEYYGILDDKFHFSLISFMNNYKLEKIYENLATIAFRFRIDSLKKDNRLEKSFQEISNIFESIKKNDCEMSKKNTILHIKKALKNILNLMS